MDKLVRLFWKSKVTGFTGNGSKVLTVETAKELVKKSNLEFPELTHWYG